MEYANDGRRHHVRIGDAIDLEVEDFVSPLDPTGAGVKLSGVAGSQQTPLRLGGQPPQG